VLATATLSFPALIGGPAVFVAVEIGVTQPTVLDE
jgi:hypothetical protein